MSKEQFDALVLMIEAIVDDQIINDDHSALRRMQIVNDVEKLFVAAAAAWKEIKDE